MAQTYTAKGTTTGKAVSTLSINNVSVTSGDLIVVGVAYDVVSKGNPTVTMGNQELNTAAGETISPWRVRQFRRRAGRNVTRDVVVTWGGNVDAAVMSVCVIKEASLEDVKSDNSNLSSANSTTGLNTVVGARLTAHVHHHMTIGPSTDAAGSVVADDTLGQRAGTVGGLATDNLTLNETYQIMVASSVSAGSFTIGGTYEINVVGDTNWVALGAASNTAGVVFVTTGTGSGTGTAYEYGNMRGRIINLATRDHAGVGVAYKSNTYTVTVGSAYHYTPKAYPHMESAILNLEDSDGNVVSVVRVPAALWDILTVDQKEGYILHCAQWAADILDGELAVITTDTDLETDIASYEGNTYEV